MKPDRLALIKAAAEKRAKELERQQKVYLRTGNTPHKAVPAWHFRMMRS